MLHAAARIQDPPVVLIRLREDAKDASVAAALRLHLQIRWCSYVSEAVEIADTVCRGRSGVAVPASRSERLAQPTSTATVEFE